MSRRESNTKQFLDHNLGNTTRAPDHCYFYLVKSLTYQSCWIKGNQLTLRHHWNDWNRIRATIPSGRCFFGSVTCCFFKIQILRFFASCFGPSPHQYDKNPHDLSFDGKLCRSKRFHGNSMLSGRFSPGWKRWKHTVPHGGKQLLNGDFCYQLRIVMKNMGINELIPSIKSGNEEFSLSSMIFPL